MKDFFETMASAERIYWYIALATSLIFIIQTILTFVGADADTGGEADFDGNMSDSSMPFQLFSLRNLINFLLGFGWAGASLYNVIPNTFLLTLVAFIVGSAFVGIFFLVMRSMIKLEENNTFDRADTIGKTADVYLTIPAKGSGTGKVTVSINGAVQELSAITDSDEKIPTRSLVRIIAVKNNILIVEKIQ